MFRETLNAMKRRGDHLNGGLDNVEGYQLCAMSVSLLEMLVVEKEWVGGSGIGGGGSEQHTSTLGAMDQNGKNSSSNGSSGTGSGSVQQLVRDSKLGSAASSPVIMKGGSSSSDGGGRNHVRAVSTMNGFTPMVKGYLSKMSSSSFRGWQRRWFVLCKYLASK